MDLEKETNLLRKVPLFCEFDASKLKLMGFVSESLAFDAGETLCHAGEVADCVYVILDGQVEILSAHDNSEVVASTLGKHELVGELGVLGNAPRLATVRAKSKVEAARIAGDLFIKLLTENPREALEVMRQLSEKIADLYKKLASAQSESQQDS